MVSGDVTCDYILIFDDEVPVTQEILTDEMIVSERTHEPNANEEGKKEDEQETDVPLSQ